MELAVAHCEQWIRAVIEPPQCLQQQVKHQFVGVGLLGEGIHQLGHVICPGAAPQVLTQQPVRLDRFGLGHQVKRLALCYQQIHVGKRLDMPGFAAGRLAHTLSQQSQFAAITRKHRQQPVRLSHVPSLQHDGRQAIKPLAALVFSFHSTCYYTMPDAVSYRFS